MSLKDCANLLLGFLNELRIHNPILFAKWFERAGSKKKALNLPVIEDYEFVKALFCKRGLDSNFPEHSYRIGIWNGKEKEEEACSLEASLGSSESKFWTNNCGISLPYAGDQYDFYQNASNQEALIELLKRYWQPEWVQIDGEKYGLPEK